MNEKKVKPQYISVPFKAANGSGTTEYNGIAKFSPAGIVFEFDSVFFGLIGSDVKEVQVALDEILDIKFRKGIYKVFVQIQLRLKNFTKLAALPNYSGQVKLKIKRADYERAQKAVEQTLQWMSAFDPPALHGADDSNEQSLPVQISVSELFDTEKLKSGNSRETNKFDKNTD